LVEVTRSNRRPGSEPDAVELLAELGLVAARLGRHRQAHHRARKRQEPELERLSGRVQRVPDLDGLDLGQRDDVADAGLAQLRLLGALEPRRVPDLDRLLGTRHDGGVAGAEASRVDAQEDDAPRLALERDPEAARPQRAVGLARDLVAVGVEDHPSHRRGAVLRQEVEQLRYTNARFGDRVEDRHERALPKSLGDRPREVVVADLARLQVLLHQLVVGLDRGLHKPLLEVRGVAEDRLDAGDGGTPLVRHGDRPGAGAAELRQGRLHGGGIEVVGVAPVDDHDAGQAVLLGGLEEAPRVEHHAVVGVDDEDGAVGGVETAQRLGDEIRIARRVDDVEGLALPLAVQERGVDGVAALPLVVGEVGDGVLVLHRPLAVDHLGGEQDRLGQRSLAGTAVAHQRDIPGVRSGHAPSPRNVVNPSRTEESGRYPSPPARSRLPKRHTICGGDM
jgi:hypothetical protein